MLATPPVAFDSAPPRSPVLSPLARKNSGTRFAERLAAEEVDDPDETKSFRVEDETKR